MLGAAIEGCGVGLGQGRTLLQPGDQVRVADKRHAESDQIGPPAGQRRRRARLVIAAIGDVTAAEETAVR